MCRAVRCRQCGKVTWAGCGEHVEQALRGVPSSQRCHGHADSGEHGGFFGRIFGR